MRNYYYYYYLTKGNGYSDRFQLLNEKLKMKGDHCLLRKSKRDQFKYA